MLIKVEVTSSKSFRIMYMTFKQEGTGSMLVDKKDKREVDGLGSVRMEQGYMEHSESSCTVEEGVGGWGKNGRF